MVFTIEYNCSEREILRRQGLGGRPHPPPLTLLRRVGTVYTSTLSAVVQTATRLDASLWLNGARGARSSRISMQRAPWARE